MKKLVIVLLGLGVLLGAALGLGYARLTSFGDTAFEVRAPILLRVEHGATLKAVLADLEHQGALTRPAWVYWLGRLEDTTAVRAGEYMVEVGETPRTLLHKLSVGQVRTEQLVIIEGHNRWQVRDLLAAKQWVAAADFDRLCDDPKFLERQGVPGPSCEGYLFPETYTLARGLAPEAVLGTMLAMFRKVYGEVTQNGTGPLGFDMRQFVTLASIVEKETGAPSERPHIACVFYNRLTENQKTQKPTWRLETDPTVIYAATLADPKFDGNIKASHLRGFKHPYNTYYVYGLPPGPISNPGRAALTAVAAPLSCPDFFFVSNNNGQSIFCPTLQCHNKAVEQWQVQYFKKQR